MWCYGRTFNCAKPATLTATSWHNYAKSRAYRLPKVAKERPTAHNGTV